jgi:hypothetical protein
MQTTRYAKFSDGSIATVTTTVARQGITVIGEAPFPLRPGQDPNEVIPYEGLHMQTENVCDLLVEAREALMRCGYASACPIANTLNVFVPRASGTDIHCATIYGDYNGLSISGPQAGSLARILDAEGVRVLVD